MPRSVLIMLLCAALLATCCRAQGASKAYPPGWNGEARTPPQGWRSWNAFGNRITQDMMVSAVDAATAKNRTVKGWPGKVSLCDLGYCSVGVDEGWEGCGAPGVVPPMRQHYPNGTPSINAKFPDLGELVDYGHKKGLKMGFYQNGCACGEHVEKVIDYQGDIDMLEKFNFDAVKLDGERALLVLLSPAARILPNALHGSYSRRCLCAPPAGPESPCPEGTRDPAPTVCPNENARNAARRGGRHAGFSRKSNDPGSPDTPRHARGTRGGPCEHQRSSPVGVHASHGDEVSES